MGHMALMPPTTSFIDSFQTSVSKFHITTRLQFFRYGSYTPFKIHPQIKSNSALKNKKKRWVFASETPISLSNPSGSLSSTSWLNNWNETHKQNGLKKPQAMVNYRNSEELSDVEYENTSNNSSFGGSGSTMERIVEKLKKFGYIDDLGENKEKRERASEKGSIEDIFYIEEGMLPNSRGGFSEKSPLGDETVFGSGGEIRFPWEKPVVKEEGMINSLREKNRSSLAQLTLPESELRRLINLALRMKHKTRVGGAGVTREVVDMIHDKWKSAEVVRLKIDGAPALNMKRMHEILERKTGGLVVWRSGTSVAMYRGVSYEAPSERLKKRMYSRNEIPRKSSSSDTDRISRDPSELGPSSSVEEQKKTESSTEMNYEDEVDELLDGLGPRYTDGPGFDPLPVDADLLPGVVRGYQPPFRLLPYGVRSTLGGKEGTALRRLARVLPPHFALGRSRQHQGLAVAMIKLWEKSSIAKIALKRGVQLTTSERMAEDIKKLTGGVLLSRNKDFLVFYRGKNFLSPDVAEALLEKERLAKALQDEEEVSRSRAAALVTPSAEKTDESGTAGTLGETLDADARWGKRLDDQHMEKVMGEANVARHANLIRKLERKLAFAERKLIKAERTLSKVEECLIPTDNQADPESLTNEERFMFRKLGLRMKAFLLLGRRGVFGGTVENMHLHWKYRELVKIIVNAKNFEQVKKIALSLEAESGGVLVSVDKVSKGYAIVVFRGKDYERPSMLRPRNLLTKRKALARSIELQRREALLGHISTLQTTVEKLRYEIEQMARVKDRGDEELYDKIDSAYLNADEESEEEGDEVYPETYESDSDNDIEGVSDHSIRNFHLETNIPNDFQDQESEMGPDSRNPLAVFNASSDGVGRIGEEDRRPH